MPDSEKTPMASPITAAWFIDIAGMLGTSASTGVTRASTSPR